MSIKWPALTHKKRIVVAALILIVVVVIVVMVGMWLLRPQYTSYSGDKIVFDYPDDYTQRALVLPPAGQRATYELKLAAEDPVRDIELAHERAAIMGARASKVDFLDHLEASSSKSLPIVYKDYKKISDERIQISGHDAAVISFKYLGSDKKTTLFAKLYMIPIENDGYYITMQSTDQQQIDKDAKIVQSSLQIK